MVMIPWSLLWRLVLDAIVGVIALVEMGAELAEDREHWQKLT
jgi:hypothetical protein